MSHVIVGPGAMGFFAELGALHATLKFDNVLEISGSSAGALAALCFILDIPLEKCLKVDTKSVFKPSIKSFIKNYGFLPRNRIYKTFKDFFGRDWTFKELYEETGKVLYVAVSVLPRNTLYYSVKNTPDESVLQTLTTSVSIPLMFAPLRDGPRMFFDGSVYESSPGAPFMSVSEEDVIQFQIDPIDANDKYPSSLLEFMVTLIKNIITMRSDYHYKIVSVPIQTSDIYNFSMDDETKIKLYARGYNSCSS
jgi:predicted acylesterase/phospholipase RssA